MVQASDSALSAFGYNAGGWRVDKHPRLLGDVNGDGKLDIVGFGYAGAYVSLSTSGGETPKFASPKHVVSDFGENAGSWRVDKHPRMLADVNGDGKADIVGFGSGGVSVAVSKCVGNTVRFGASNTVLSAFGYSVGGWRIDKHPRMLADVNGDGKADIIGFGYSGVYVALSTSGLWGAAFLPPKRVLSSFGYHAGNWRTDRHPRMMADVNGDRKADIVGFGNFGVTVALSTSHPLGGVAFASPKLVVSNFGYSAGGWRMDKHPRMMADVNGDRKADIVGFGNSGVYVALSNSQTTKAQFRGLTSVSSGFGYNAGGWRVDKHPRMLADVNGDRKADIVGFGYAGPYVALSGSSLTQPTFASAVLVDGDFGYRAGSWRTDRHPRMLADINGDRRADIVGFGYGGVNAWLSRRASVYDPLKLSVTSLQCFDENEGHLGSDDEPYVLVHSSKLGSVTLNPFRINPPDAKVTKIGPWQDVDDDGDHHPAGGNILWGLNGQPEVLDDLTEVRFLVAAVENDRSNPDEVRNWVENRMWFEWFANGSAPKGDETTRRMVEDMKAMVQEGAKKGLNPPFVDSDELINVHELRLTTGDLQAVYDLGSTIKILRFVGAGADYRVYFRLSAE